MTKTTHAPFSLILFFVALRAGVSAAQAPPKFPTSAQYPIDHPIQAIHGDLNNDGSLDAIVYNSTNANILCGLLNNGAGTLSAPAPLVPNFNGGFMNIQPIGDLNQDGVVDIVGVPGSNFFYVVLSQNILSYAVNTVNTSYSLENAILSDLTGDGKLDIAGERSKRYCYTRPRCGQPARYDESWQHC
ncbi:MAG: FG-GAP repeat domain-containing protein [Planctomycetota bacterium]